MADRFRGARGLTFRESAGPGLAAIGVSTLDGVEAWAGVAAGALAAAGEASPFLLLGARGVIMTVIISDEIAL